MSGAVHIDPFDTIGLPPMTTSRSVRSMSGTATDSPVPYMRPTATCCGIWSTVLAVNTNGVPSDLITAGP